MPRYNHATIEPKWQAYWEKNQTFAAPRMPKPGSKKLYALDMFPYPSGDGLHVGHPEGYTATDIVCRAARMQGKSVMHPMGFDAFGLPAEEHAIKTGEHPRMQTEKNIANVPPPAEVAWLLVRLGPRAGDDRRRVLPLDAVDLPADLRHVVRRRAAARPADQRAADSGRRAVAGRRCGPRVSGRASARVSNRSAGELVPGAGHGAGERRSDRRQERSAAATRSCACRCGNGCCGSRRTPIGWKRIWKASIGPKASKPCSATGSAAARERKSISIIGDSGCHGDRRMLRSKHGNRSREDRLSRASLATTCCASTRRGPIRFSVRPTW